MYKAIPNVLHRGWYVIPERVRLLSCADAGELGMTEDVAMGVERCRRWEELKVLHFEAGILGPFLWSFNRRDPLLRRWT